MSAMCGLLHRILVFFSFISLVLGQTFTVPSAWRKTITTLSHQSRISLADGVVSTVNHFFNSINGLFNGLNIPQSANMLCALAVGDRIRNSTGSKQFVLQSLNTTFGLAPTIVTLRGSTHQNSDAAIWGLAAINAYRAYKDTQSLSFAESTWYYLNNFMISADDATAGTQSTRNATFPSACRGASTAGGVFYVATDPNSTVVNGETVAAFMALSAHLYEETSNAQYLAAAKLSADFVTNVLYDGNVIIDGITLTNCAPVNAYWTYNSGFTIDALSVLAGFDSSRAQFLENLISIAVTYPQWTNTSDGVIIEGPANGDEANKNSFTVAIKGIFIRSLFEAYTRIPANDSAQATFIRSFITVQLNALLDVASASGSNQYSPRWEGPRPTQLLPWGQLAALDVLNAAIGLGDVIDVTPSASPSAMANPENSPSNGAHHLSGGAVAGIVVGTVFLLGLCVIVMLIMIRKTRRRDKALEVEGAVEPFEPPDRDEQLREALFRRTGVRLFRSTKHRRGQRSTTLSDDSAPITGAASTSQTGHSNSSTPSNYSVMTSDPAGMSSDEHYGYSTAAGAVVVDINAFQSLIARMDRVLTSHSSNAAGSAHGSDEEPPRYEDQ